MPSNIPVNMPNDTLTETAKILQESITSPIDQPSKALAVLFNLYASRAKIRTDQPFGNFVCCDLKSLEEDGIISMNACKLATEHIEKLLLPSLTICGWIRANHPELYDAVYSAQANKAAAWYEYKMAWMQDMISFWKEQGL